MKKTTVALLLAAVMAVAANPALAHCGGSHGKSHRAAAAAKKPATATTTKPSGEVGPAAGTSEPPFMPGQAQLEGPGSQA